MPSTMPSTTKTNAGLAGALIAANDWLKTRIANIDIFDEHYQAEAKTNPFYALGSIFYLVWVIVMFTGLVLIMWYIPTKAAAYDSILNIQHGILFGNIVRGMHKYGADAMIIAATIRMFRMFINADYKPGKEFNIAIGLVTLLLSMYSGLTGYLLIWNQRAFWATKVFATFPTYMDQFPGMGDFYLPLVKSMHMGWNTAEFLLGAGGAITQETITRFFSLHLAFSLIPLIFVELYFYKTGYKRISINWTKRIIVTLMIAVVAIILPAALGGRSNPDVTPLPILSDWYFLGLYQMYKYLEPVVATEITMVIPLSVVLLPFIDVWLTGPEKDISKRPMIFWVTLMGLINWIVFSFLIIFNIANIHNDPPFWRDSLYLMIDIGILLQLALIWKESNLVQRAKGAFAGMVMGIVGAVQTVVAIVYFFMAKTEMFLSPITQAWTYAAFRPFMGNHAQAAENLVREGVKGSVPYWNYPEIIAKGGDIPPVVTQVAEICKQATPLDGLFQIAPTFIEGLKYNGLIDFMVSNRWCFDYATYVDRMEGVGTSVLAQPIPGNPPYPLPVPDLDWVWMIAGVVVMVLGFGTMWWCKKTSQQTQQAQAPAQAS